MPRALFSSRELFPWKETFCAAKIFISRAALMNFYSVPSVGFSSTCHSLRHLSPPDFPPSISSFPRGGLPRQAPDYADKSCSAGGGGGDGGGFPAGDPRAAHRNGSDAEAANGGLRDAPWRPRETGGRKKSSKRTSYIFYRKLHYLSSGKPFPAFSCLVLLCATRSHWKETNILGESSVMNGSAKAPGLPSSWERIFHFGHFRPAPPDPPRAAALTALY